MSEQLSDLPQAESADPDGVQVALRAAHALWSRGDTAESLKWLRKAAESASDEGADFRSLQLAKAAAELRAKLFGSSEAPRSGLPPAAAPGESGAHPIAQLRSESEPPRSAAPSSPPFSSQPFSSQAPPVDAFALGNLPEEGNSGSSRPVTATQYPSHRPRQRMGLLSSSPGAAAQRDGAAYAAVPSWSADSERRISTAPPPLPQASSDDYEELEAEPDEDAADDPGSVWSSSGPDSWQPAPPNALAGATPPPLPPRGAFADDDTEFTRQSEPPTVVIPPIDENDEEARLAHDARRGAASVGITGNFPSTFPGSAWDQQSRIPGWEQETGSSWAAELHQSTWGNGANLDGAVPEPPPQSETGRAKLTARIHHQAVRVSFAPDLRVPGQYVVRPLREGEKAATGERIALLVALEPGIPLV